MNIRPLETPDDAIELPCPPDQSSPYLATELAAVPFMFGNQVFPRTISLGYFTPPPMLAVHLQEGRLIPELRSAASTHDPTEILTRAAIRQCQATAIANPPGFEGLPNALADLAVTGGSAYSNFVSSPPNEGQIQTALIARYPSQPTLFGPPGPTPTAAQAAAAVNAVLDRAYEVAWFLNGASARGNLGWIAVSAEDDFPHRPVNVPATAYPQFDAYVAVPGSVPGAEAILIRTRYTIATSATPIKPPAMFESASPPVSAPRFLPPAVGPALPATGGIILYVHGSDSRLEEAELVMPPLVGTPQAPTGFSVISVDLPGSGYVNPIDPDEVGIMPSNTTVPPINPGFDYDVVLMPFLERFIIAFLGVVSSQLGQPGLVEGRMIAAMGGSLGGNMALRLGRHPELFPNVVAYSAGSTWDSFYAAPLTKIGVNAQVCSTCFQRTLEGPVGGSKALSIPPPIPVESSAGPGTISIDPGIRGRFFSVAFDQVILPVLNPHSQPDQWYRDNWPCKADFINNSRLDRWEIYNAATRRWHWRISLEELIFSWARPFNGPTPAAIPEAYVGPAACTEVKSRVLLGAGAADNYIGSAIFESTQKIAAMMVANDGDTFYLDRTGHSIHAERPTALAAKVLAFLSSRNHVICTAAGNVVELWWQPSTGWHISQISSLAGSSVMAAGSPCGCVDPDGTLHIFYRGATDNLIHELWWSPTHIWQTGSLSATSGAAAADGNPTAYVESSGMQHVIYRGKDGKIHELYRALSGSWAAGTLSDAQGPQLAQGDPCGYSEPGVQHVMYRGVDKNINELYWTAATSWQVGTLNKTQVEPAAGDPFGYADNGVQHVVYRGDDKKIHEFYWTLANGWQGGALSNTLSRPAAGDPCAYADATGVQHVMYLGDDNLIHEYYWTPANGWQVGSLSATPGISPAAGDPCAYVDPDGVHHVMYRGTDSLLHELYFAGNGWQMGTLSGTSNPVTGDPVGFVL